MQLISNGTLAKIKIKIDFKINCPISQLKL